MKVEPAKSALVRELWTENQGAIAYFCLIHIIVIKMDMEVETRFSYLSILNVQWQQRAEKKLLRTRENIFKLPLLEE